LEGLVLLDKPEGVSSNGVLQRVKRLLGAKKAGHTGTLDPFASGMLPILLGTCTKLATFYLADDKRYAATLRLGSQTDTGDRDGQVIEEKAVPVLTQEKIEQALLKLQGSRLQMPPLYSALKFQGKPLYQWAREGHDIPRTARPIKIQSIQLIQFDTDNILIEVACSKGTYIRTLVEEIAELLGTVAYCSALRRLTVGDFDSSQMWTLEALEQAVAKGQNDFLLSGELGVLNLPVFEMDDIILHRVRRGLPLDPSIAVSSGFLRLRSSQTLLGVGKIDERRIITGRWL
jgi:tRNA pseudouridine55 synthase